MTDWLPVFDELMGRPLDGGPHTADLRVSQDFWDDDSDQPMLIVRPASA